MLVDVFSQGHHRQGRRGGARQGRHHGQQERHPVRPEPADGRQRHPHRHAGGHHAAACASRRWTSIGRLIARALATPDDDAALGSGARRKSRRCAGSSRCIPELAELSAAVAAAFARRRRAGAGARPASSRAPASSRWRAAVADVFDDGGIAARRSRHRHRQDARLPGPGDPQPPARARLDRHQEPPGADLLQGPAGAARRARRARSPPTYMKGRANYLCLHRFDHAARQ